MPFSVRPIEPGDKDWIESMVQSWGAEFIVSCGRKLYPQQLPGFVAVDNGGEFAGLITYEIIGDQCEVVTLDALMKFSGIGTLLMKATEAAARDISCKRLWLITTNDNLDAIRFYQRRGMTIADIHVNALEQSRQLKPQIPEIGNYGIPLRDEIVFEMML